MTPDEREQMAILCQRIAIEQDRQKFTQLVDELNKLLERKQVRLKPDDPLAKPKGSA